MSSSATAKTPFDKVAELSDTEVSESMLAVCSVLEAALPNRRVMLYEAVGGSTTYMPPGLLARSDVTVVDIDPNQIGRCTYASTKHVGDIQKLRLEPGTFDLVVCFNVIEHLEDVQGALEGFCAALRSGGLLFIGAPNPRSLSGFVTRFSPHWFHVFYYRYVLHYSDAGKPGHPPFPTIFHPLVTPGNLKRFMSEAGFDTIYERTYESERYPFMRRRHPALARCLDLLAVTINALMLNSTDVRRGDYHFVFRKR